MRLDGPDYRVRTPDVYTWALGAIPGQRVVYAEREDGWGPAQIPDNFTRAKGRAMKAHEVGIVFLSQRRVDKRWFYEATRVSERTARRVFGYVGPWLVKDWLIREGAE